MEKLLKAIASRLEIRLTVAHKEEQEVYSQPRVTVGLKMFEHCSVDEETRKKFKEVLNNHLAERIKRAQVGDVIEYLFEYGQVLPLGTIQDNANDNMAEVLRELPALGKGEEYVLPVDTYLSFRVTGVNGNGVDVMPRVSNWIMEAYQRA